MAQVPLEDQWSPANSYLLQCEAPRGFQRVWFILHHCVSLSSVERHFQADLFSWALVLWGHLSEHGSNMLCKQADCSLERFSKPAMCRAGLGSSFRRALSLGLGLCSAANVKRSPPLQSHASPHMVSPGRVPGLARLPAAHLETPPPTHTWDPCRIWQLERLPLALSWPSLFLRTISAAVNFKNPIKGNQCVHHKGNEEAKPLYYGREDWNHFNPWVSHLSEFKNDCIILG